MSLGMKKLRQFSQCRDTHRRVLPLNEAVESRASSPVQAEGPKTNKSPIRISLYASHPERSRIKREAHDPAQSKDPYTTRTVVVSHREPSNSDSEKSLFAYLPVSSVPRGKDLDAFTQLADTHPSL